MPPFREPAPAKVNLYLHVVGRRADGYHLLDSVAVFPGAGDIVSGAPAPTLSLELTGPYAASLTAGPDNLVLRAARALGPGGARLVLDKLLPVASGIGGGSADAAATLRLLTRLWQMPPDDPHLHAVAAALGADVPVCLAAAPRRMRGIGERLEPAPQLPPHGMVLINPGAALATASVFARRLGAFTPAAELPPAWPDAPSMARFLSALTNDLEPAAIGLCPAIADVLAALRSRADCLLARMSGSGATCFGLFPDHTTAAASAAALTRPGWWIWHTN